MPSVGTLAIKKPVRFGLLNRSSPVRTILKADYYTDLSVFVNEKGLFVPILSDLGSKNRRIAVSCWGARLFDRK